MRQRTDLLCLSAALLLATAGAQVVTADPIADPHGYLRLIIESEPELTIPEPTLSLLRTVPDRAGARPSAVEIRWAETTLSTPEGRSLPISLALEITPGPALPYGDAVVNVVQAIDGALTTGHGATLRSWRIEQGNLGSHFALSRYLGDRGTLWWFLPILLHESGDEGPGIHGALSILFEGRRGRYEWRWATLFDFQGALRAQRFPYRPLHELVAGTGERPLEAPMRELTSLDLGQRSALQLEVSPVRSPLDPAQLSSLFEVQAYPDCNADRPALDLTFMAGRIALGKTASTFDLQLRLVPGASFESNGVVRNVLAGLTGTLAVMEAETLHEYRIHQDNRGSLVATSNYSPATGRLEFELPVVLDDVVRAPMPATLSISCRRTENGLSCPQNALMDVVVTSGAAPRSHESLADRLAAAGGTLRPARQERRPSPQPSASLQLRADTGCQAGCENCVDYGCDDACGGGGGGLLCTDKGSPDCCMSGGVTGCRYCTPTVSCQATGHPVVLATRSGRLAEFEACPQLLNRMKEFGPGERFLAEEWAVFKLHGAETPYPRRIEQAGASSFAFARMKAACLRSLQPRVQGLAADRPEILLLIDHPIHPFNERYIPYPSVALRATLPEAGPPVRAVIRVEVDATRSVERIDLLHADGELPEGFLTTIGRHLELRYADDRSHRLAVYALVKVEGGRIELQDSEVVLPRCCDPCPPPPYQCP